ncbi:hypothetical protein VQ02_06315 [Methylobacterium variabile]|uniref:Uncharacterized protein n=1 Tax=Methylobacterium variabile TaxID=298794 RepID=A0A0J6T5N7_9HYPH|nr:hypothetical protein [Methylobacterium variabile]KMO41117.1 hypothetical protein VQ02_06315 [Methylobacterium variabile]
MASRIDLDDLPNLTPEAILAWPRAVPIKDDAQTIALLLPVRRVSPEYMRKVLADIEAAAARRTAEEDALIDRLLTGRGIDERFFTQARDPHSHTGLELHSMGSAHRLSPRAGRGLR